MDLATVTIEDFAPHVGQQFTVDAGSAALALTLRSVEGSGQRWDPSGREAFSILFGGPHDPALAQGTYHVRHDAFGGIDIFLVPVGPDDQGHRYEAVFT
ncbi:MAG TPA: hypothetical protein VGB64_03120 [Actinomycetota bacterium]